MQLLMVEKSKITITWSDKQIDEVVDHNYNSLHLCVEDGQWSKSSSMTTINLRDQPIISEPEPKNIEITLFFLLSQPRLLVSLYQNFIISIVYSTFKVSGFRCVYQALFPFIYLVLQATIVYRLIYEWNIVDAIEHLLYISTHMVPYIISLIIGGVLCDRFGAKKVGLMSVTFIALALVWLGMLDRQYPSWIIIPAMAATGFSMAGIQVSLLVDMMLLVTVQESNDIQKSRGFVRVLALWESMDALGLFFGSLLSALKITTGHFWLYLILSCLCATCAPFMYFYMGFHTKPFNRSLSDMLEAPNSISHSKFPSAYMIKSTVLTL
jgi:MFS family permease